jgi:hypothetical protein
MVPSKNLAKFIHHLNKEYNKKVGRVGGRDLSSSIIKVFLKKSPSFPVSMSLVRATKVRKFD